MGALITLSGRGGIDDTNLKHDSVRGPNEHWRKYDEEGDWRTTGSRSYDKLGEYLVIQSVCRFKLAVGFG